MTKASYIYRQVLRLATRFTVGPYLAFPKLTRCGFAGGSAVVESISGSCVPFRPCPIPFTVTLARHAVCDAMPLPMLFNPHRTLPAFHLWSWGDSCCKHQVALVTCPLCSGDGAAETRALELGSQAMRTTSQG